MGSGAGLTQWAGRRYAIFSSTDAGWREAGRLSGSDLDIWFAHFARPYHSCIIDCVK